MGAAEESERLDIWKRREGAVYGVIPYGALALSTVLAVTAGPPERTALLAILVLSAVTAGWILWFVTLHPSWPELTEPAAGAASRADRARTAVYYVGLLILAGALVLLSPLYGFFAWVGYLHAFLALAGRWRLLGVAGTALVSGTAQNGGLPTDRGSALVWAVITLFNLGLAGAMSWFGAVTERQNANRKQVIEELAEANRKLEATMRENAGLHAQLVAQAREAGVLDERQRMAREIHDTIAQGLAGIITQLEAAEQSRDRYGDWQRHVDTAVALARESLTEARRSVRAIGPESLESARLPEVLAELAERWSEVHGVPARLTLTGTVRQLHPEIEVTLLRTAQEALTNVAKHAGASRVGLTLSYMEDLVTLDVRDDGAGFVPAVTRDTGSEPARTGGGGFGLTSMRQRVSGVAGRLEIESEPGAGTAISASVPVPAGGDR